MQQFSDAFKQRLVQRLVGPRAVSANAKCQDPQMHPLTEVDSLSYETSWLPHEKHIFSGEDPVDGLFVDRAWRLAPLPGGLLLDDDHFRALADTASRMRDSKVPLAMYGEHGHHGPRFLLSWEYSLFEEAANETLLGHVDAVLFGESESWGMFTSPETFAVVGGTEEFMAAFEERVGGRAALEERFRQLALDGAIGFGEKGRAYVDALLTVAGWRPLKR